METEKIGGCLVGQLPELVIYVLSIEVIRNFTTSKTNGVGKAG
jgi:hypothetical protein